MIVTEKQAKYHLKYLSSLNPLRSGQYDNELLNDGIHRVLLSRIGKADGMDYDNQVTIEVDDRQDGSWRKVSEYPADTGPLYCVPVNCGLASTDRAVASRITKMITGLELVNEFCCSGRLPNELRELSYSIRCKLIAQGWRITNTDKGWKVLCPRPGVRNDGGN